MDLKFRNLVEDIMWLADSIGNAGEELKDGGDLSGESGRQFMNYALFEILNLKQRCNDMLSSFTSSYPQDYARLCLQYATISNGSVISAN